MLAEAVGYTDVVHRARTISLAAWKHSSRFFARPTVTIRSSAANTASAVRLGRSDGGGSDVAMTITSAVFCAWNVCSSSTWIGSPVSSCDPAGLAMGLPPRAGSIQA